MRHRKSYFFQQILFYCAIGFAPVIAIASDLISTNVHSVNYSGYEFTSWVEDPLNARNRGGGESVSPYSAGGIMCCYSLPERWHSGIQVTIHATHSFQTSPEAKLSEISETHTVEVPPYVDGKVGELWIIREGDGTYSVVSSDFQPNHEKWPGKVKGWPVPSLEYRRVKWDLLINLEEKYVKVYLDLLKNLDEDPQASARKAWTVQSKYQSETLKIYSGPDDERYLKFLKNDYQNGLSRSMKSLDGLRAHRP
jgi:hypothetical protein